MPGKYSIRILFFILTTSTVSAQRFTSPNTYFDHLSAVHGLSSYSITDILQDHQGFIWIATISGLNRFDGYTATIYNTDADTPYTLPNSRISDLAEDADHYLWMYDDFTQKLFRLDPSRTRFERVELPQKNIIRLKQDQQQRIWLFSKETAYYWDKQTKRFLSHTLPGFQTVKASLPEADPLLSAVGPDILLSGFTKQTLPGYASDSSVQLAITILKAIQENVKARKLPLPLHISDVLSIDPHTFWVSTSNCGIFVVEKKITDQTWHKENICLSQLTHLPGLDYTLTSNNITTLHQDNEGSIWVGTEDKGVNVYGSNGYSFSKVTHAHDKNYWNEIGTVRALAEDDEKNLWIGTQENGVMVLDSLYQFKFSLKDEIPSKTIRSLYLDRTGKVWIGHYGGLSSYDPRTREVHNGYLERYRKNDLIFRAYEIKEDPQGYLWVSFWNFLIRYHPKTGKAEEIDLSKGIPDLPDVLKIRCFDFSPDSKLWVGTENQGLLRYDPLTKCTTAIPLKGPDIQNGAASTNIFKITFTHQGNLLLATADGLYIYNPTTQQTYCPKSKEKINFQRTYGALEDRHTGIWVSTVNGMWYYQPRSDSTRLFDYYDGLSSNEFTKNGLLQRQDGTIVFGCNKGIIYFHPQQLKLSTVSPGLLVSGPHGYTQEVSPLELNADQKSVRLQAKVLSYLAPQKNRIAYRLKGWEENWHYQHADEPVIFYENIPEGSYSLEIKGFREGLERQATLLSIPLIKHPPFWKKGWFLALILTFVLSGIWLLHKRRVNRIRREKELQIRHYESELKLLKSQISPHFLFNTLNNIYSLCILEPQKAATMVMNLSKMLRYMLYECQGDRVPLAKELSFLEYYVYMQLEKTQQNHKIAFDIEGPFTQQAIVPMLLINFVENSFKHSDLIINPNGFIRIHIQVQEAMLTLHTTNTFSETKPETLVQAGGLGIENTRKRLELFYPQRHELNIRQEANTYSVQLMISMN
jgi:ligand-binding sensor domain-containing protein